MSPFVMLQHLLPKLALTRFAGLMAQSRAGRLTHAQIRWFVRRYGVDLSEAAQPDPAAYACFNDFFTRALRSDARPLAQADWICPVDGTVSQLGRIEGDQVFQAKGHRYSTQALLGGDAKLARAFDEGEFATLYLSPRDYHRIHMPCAAVLRRMTHVPGELFSVNPQTAAGVPGLFARNERVVCWFDMPDGRPMALVLVGATIVGSMATVWHGVVNPPRPGQVRHWDYAADQHLLAQGAEMGRFLLGSTVVLLWPRGTIRLNPDWQAGTPVRMGQAMGLRA
jgi:phosphatidylserine decarboxylase